MSKRKILLAGAGLVGSLWATFLSKKGFKVDVYERRPDMRSAHISAGRSINLALSDRGWRALETAGIAETIRKIAIPMHGRMIHQADGNLSFQPYGKEGQAIYSVSRGELNKVMMTEAEKSGDVSIHFESEILNVDFATPSVEVKSASGDVRSVSADIIFGTDGAFSAVRQAMQKTDRFNYSQSYLEHAYKELSIPAAADGQWLLEKNALHIWPRNRFMLIALPNLDGSFTCTLFLPFDGEISFAALKNKSNLLAFFRQHFPDALEMMDSLETDFYENPTSSLVTIRCFPWSGNGNVCLLGDAAHAIVPFFGQGMNAGFEDCSILNKLLLNNNENWEGLFEQFETLRKPDADAIADLAIQNFIEMRDLVADPQFLKRKRLEKLIHEKYPEEFLPVYSMVTFSDTPYSEALNVSKSHDKLLKKVLEIPNVEEQWDSLEIQNRIEIIIKELKN